MSDIEVDPNCQSALDTLMEAEESTRVALIRLEFRYFSEFGIERTRDLEEIAALMRALQGDAAENVEEGGELNQQASKEASRPAYLDERDAEERAVIEQQEDILGRRMVKLLEDEAFDRLRLTGMAFELAIVISEAFKPCFTMMYRYPWDVNDYRLLPIKPHALDRVKNPERHLPPHMRKEYVAHTEAALRLQQADHAAAYQQTLEALKGPAPPLQLTAA